MHKNGVYVGKINYYYIYTAKLVVHCSPVQKLTGSWRRKLIEEMFDLRKEEGKSISCLDDFIFVDLACCKLADMMRYDFCTLQQLSLRW